MMCETTPDNCVEANLDVQYLMAISQTPTTFWYSPSNQSFSDWLLTVANTDDPPLIISISYGSEERFMTSSELDAFNLEAQKLGAMGVTILIASGDDGAVGSGARTGPHTCGYHPDFPSGSPVNLLII
jgi:tripeptidyl-peptidase-1